MQLTKKQQGILITGVAAIIMGFGWWWLEMRSPEENIYVSENDAYVRPKFEFDTTVVNRKSAIEDAFKKKYNGSSTKKASFIEISEERARKEREARELDSLREVYKAKLQGRVVDANKREVVDQQHKVKPVKKKVSKFNNQTAIANRRTVSVNNTLDAKEEVKPAPIRKRREGIITSGGSSSRSDSNRESSSLKSTDQRIQAVIHGDQDVYNGGKVKLRITQDCKVSGQKIRRNTYVWGIAKFSGERVDILFENITISGRYYAFNMMVYEEDGMKGIYVPGGTNQEIKNDGVSNVGNSVTDYVDPTSGIIGAVTKSITSGVEKKAEEVSVTLTDNYSVVLKSTR